MSEEPPTPKEPLLLSTYIAGGIGGLVVECAYFPIDTIKTRMQAMVHKNKVEVGSMMKGGLYQGIQATILSAFPVGFGYIFGYNYSRSLMNKWLPNLNEHYVNLCGGIFAEVCCNAVRCPFEVSKQQMQVGLDRSLSATVRNIYKTSGVSGFYKGMLPLILRDAPYSASFMPIYEYLKKIRKLDSTRELSFYDHLVNSAVSATIASFLTHPMDTVKTRMMTQRYDNSSFFETANQHYREHGIRGFYRAYLLRMVNAIYFAMVFFGVYEKSITLVDPLLH